MAISKKCDRCGALYEIYNEENSAEKVNGFKLLNLDKKQAYFEHGPYDLCPECCDEFMRWFQQEGEDISRYKTLFEDHSILKNEFDSLRKRFHHLLKSKFIASFDEWNPKTNDYKRDISEADKIFNAEGSVEDITTILMDSDAVTCTLEHCEPEIYASNALYHIPSGYCVRVDYDKLAKAIYDAGYKKSKGENNENH